MWTEKCSILLDPINQEKVKKTKESLFFFSEGSEPFLQHLISDCLMNQGIMKKKTYYGNFSTVFVFLSLPRTAPGCPNPLRVGANI